MGKARVAARPQHSNTHASTAPSALGEARLRTGLVDKAPQPCRESERAAGVSGDGYLPKPFSVHR
jgi:hypothetical protein